MAATTPTTPSSARRIAAALALPAILLVGLALRVYRLLEFPPGFHFDEAIDLKIALDVLGGARPIYVAEGWGREALYYYLVAPMLRLIDYNPLALRATAVLCGMGVLVAAYGLAWRLHGRPAAWLTTAWLAVAMWPVWAARFGVRHIALALLLGLAAWAFWWAFGGVASGGRRVAGGAPAAPLNTALLPTDLLNTDLLNTEHWPLTTTLPFALAGLLLGLTAYTYQPARFVPLLFGGFALYLLLFHRRPKPDNQMWHNRGGWLVWGAAAVLVALPLALLLTRVTPIETGERAFSIEPLTELLAGNPRPVAENLVAVAGVFTVRGDPLKSYNLPDRPLFVPRLTGLFFYAGLALAVWRWRRPAYAFVLLWLVVGLLPSVVTISAPNFNRMVAAQFPVFFLAGLGAAEFIRWAAGWGRPSPQPSPKGRGGQTAPDAPSSPGRGNLAGPQAPFPSVRGLGRGNLAGPQAPSPPGRGLGRGVLAALVVAVALAATTYATIRDLFHVWPEQFADAHPLNREIAAVARFLETTADGRPVVISSRDIEDEDPYVVAVSLDRIIDRRWVDSSQALALPTGAAEAWLIVTADRWIDPLLADVANVALAGGLELAGGLKPTATTQNRLKPVEDDAGNPLKRVWIDSRGFQPAGDPASEFFSLHLLTAANWPTLPTPDLSLPPESSFAPTYPTPFCACEPGAAAEPALWLTGVEPGAARPGEELTLLTSWETGRARFLSLAMFVHLLDATGNIVAQDDGLGYPPHTWQPGDRFLQLARLPLPLDLPPGEYTLQFGLYDRATGARWPVLDEEGQVAGDRLLLPPQQK